MKRAIVVAIVLALALPAATPAYAQKGKELFWVKCEVTRPEAAVDPIASFGKVAPHTHVFFGTKVSSTTTNQDLRARARTNCSAPKDFSGYWMPTVHDADGALLTPDDLLVYYRRARPGPIVPFPKGFKRVSEDVYYSCGRGTPTTPTFTYCEPPTSPRMIIVFRPRADERNFPEVRLDVRWTSHPGEDASTWVASSDDMAPRHGDFMNGWDRRALRRLIDRCLNRGELCGKIT